MTTNLWIYIGNSVYSLTFCAILCWAISSFKESSYYQISSERTKFCATCFFQERLTNRCSFMLYAYLCYPLWGGGTQFICFVWCKEMRIWKNGVMDFFIFTFLTFQILIETNLFLILCLIKSPPLFKENHFFSP